MQAGAEAACWRVEKQGVSVLAGGMILERALVRIAVEGVAVGGIGAGLRRRLVAPASPLAQIAHGARARAIDCSSDTSGSDGELESRQASSDLKDFFFTLASIR